MAYIKRSRQHATPRSNTMRNSALKKFSATVMVAKRRSMCANMSFRSNHKKASKNLEWSRKR